MGDSVVETRSMEGEEKLCVTCIKVIIYRKRISESTEGSSIHDKE